MAVETITVLACALIVLFNFLFKCLLYTLFNASLSLYGSCMDSLILVRIPSGRSSCSKIRFATRLYTLCSLFGFLSSVVSIEKDGENNIIKIGLIMSK